MYALIACLVIFTSVSMFMYIGLCRPLKAYWDVGVDGKCLSHWQEMGIIIAQGGRSKHLDMFRSVLIPASQFVLSSQI